MTRVHIPRETTSRERRVAATPETVKAMVSAGLAVSVEPEAGLAAGFSDEAYEAAGAAFRGSFEEADVALTIHVPDRGRLESLRRGASLISGMQPTLELDAVEALRDTGVTSFAMDLMPRITRAQKMDVLSSQATIAGYQAVLLAATQLPRIFPLMMTAAGTIKPAKVFVLGAGVAGLQAIATAKRLGAMVEANDVRAAAREQVESLGARFVDTGTMPSTEGGYAKEATADYLANQAKVLGEHLADSDVLITTALIPGRRAPRVIGAELVARMRPTSVIVDLAASHGGNVEGTVPGETVTIGGVTIMGETNPFAMVSADASRMWARNVFAFLESMLEESVLSPSWEDEIVSATLVTREGEILHQATRDALASRDERR